MLKNGDSSDRYTIQSVCSVYCIECIIVVYTVYCIFMGTGKVQNLH